MNGIDVSSLPTSPIGASGVPLGRNSTAPFANGVQGLVGDFDYLSRVFVNPVDNVQICKNNPRRVYLAICGGSAGTTVFSPFQFPATTNDGFRSNNPATQLEFWWAKSPLFTIADWYVRASGLSNVTVYEIIWSPNRVT